MKVIIDISKAISTITQEYAYLSKNDTSTVIVRALNRSIIHSRAAVSKNIRKRYSVKAKAIKDKTTITRAHKGRHAAILAISGAPMPLISFGARQTRRGVTVKISRRRSLVPSAFIQTVGGHVGVFARGKYEPKGFKFRKKRGRTTGNDLAINELKTLSIPNMLQQHDVLDHVIESTERHFLSRLKHEMSYLSNKYY